MSPLVPRALLDLCAPSDAGRQFAHLLQKRTGLGISSHAIAAAGPGLFQTPIAQQLPPPPPSQHQQPLQPQQPRNSASGILAAVRRIVSPLLDDEQCCADDALLMQWGMDSMGATELAGMLTQQFNIRVPPTLIFSCPTIKDIVSFLCDNLGVQLATTPKVVGVGGGIGGDEALRGDATARDHSETGIDLADTDAEPSCSSTEGSALSNSQQQHRTSTRRTAKLDDVAIIGTSLTFPGGCSDLDRLWEILQDRESTSVETPADRWDVGAVLRANNVSSDAVRARMRQAHFLTHSEQFDPQSFLMTAQEARAMHESHRLLLLNARRALQDSGYFGDTLCTNTGVYVGIGGVVAGR